MHALPQRLVEAMTARTLTPKVDARLLILAGDIGYEETLLPEGVLSVLRKTNTGFYLSIPKSLGPRTKNQVCAHALAHVLLHGDRFETGDAHIDKLAGVKNPFTEADPLDIQDDTKANSLALEILIPTVSLREQLTYTQGNLKKMSDAFDMPVALVHRALVRQNLLDPASTTEDV